RLRNIDVAAFDEFRHLTVEQRQQQRANVCAVDVGVGHDDDAVVAQLVDVEIGADAGTQCGDQGGDLFAGDQAVEARLLDVQYLAAQRQNGLELAVAALLGRATRGVPFHDVKL